MPNKQYQRGVRFERELVNQGRKKGHLSARTAGSHGRFDVIDFDMVNRYIRLVQCKVKRNKKKAGLIEITDKETYINSCIQTYKITKYTR